MLRFVPTSEFSSTKANPELEFTIQIKPDRKITSTITYAYEPLVKLCDTYLRTFEQCAAPISEFSMVAIQKEYDLLWFENEKEALRYRIQALIYLQTVEKRLGTEESFSKEEWQLTYDKVKQLVSSKVRQYYLDELEKVQPLVTEKQEEQPNVAQQLMTLYGEKFIDLPHSLRKWLQEQVSIDPSSLSSIATEKFTQLDHEWNQLISTTTAEEWWDYLQTIVLSTDIQLIGTSDDWKAVFEQRHELERWDLLLQVGKKQVNKRNREAREALENQGTSSTIPSNLLLKNHKN